MGSTFIPMPRGFRSRGRRPLDFVSLFNALAIVFLPAGAIAASCPAGTVYLTFDTGSMHAAELIARTLEEENVKATFFLANEKTYRNDYSLDPSWGSYWKKLAAAGHVFGNHTWSHLYARRDEGGKVIVAGSNGERALDQKAYCDELRKVEHAFERDTGQKLAGIWRAPGGRSTQQSVRFAASCGYPIHVQWDDAGFIGDELPSETYPNKLLLERALKNIGAGNVLMMHLGIWSRKEPAAPILKPLIQGLKQRGFCFGTLEVAGR